MKTDDILKIIEKALELKEGSISVDSQMDDVEKWDSLGHLSILVALDKNIDGNISEISELATADSISKITGILKNHNFL